VTQGTLFTVGVAVVVSATLLGVYDRLLSSRPRPMATADVARVYGDKQAEFTRKVAESTDDVSRDKAVADAKNFGVKLEKALTALTQECACLVISRSAILSATPEMVDLTERLQAMVARDD
jgi:hypothetical protein